MAEVVTLHSAARFDAARWVADWEAVGGRCFLAADIPGGPLPRVLLLAPMVSAHSPEWFRMKALQAQTEDRCNVDAVADFIGRRKTTRGW